MFHGGLFVVLVTCVVLAATRESPHADTVRQLFQNIDMRHSDNVFEDGLLDVPGLIRKYRYPVEVHTVTTKDGYILEMHRIPYGRDANNDPNKKRPVVFLMHGMVSSSADLVIMGPGSALGYILAEEGFDVWMGNARGNYYSRRHVSLNPDVANTFWKFSWDEIGNIDLPTMIDYALKVSGQERLHYIGHSQGTTSFFVLGSLQPAYNDKIISMHAMAPSAYFEHIENPFLRLVARYVNNIERLAYLLGTGEYLPNSEALTWAGQNLCHDEAVFQPMCSNIVFLIGGWNEDQHNATMIPAILGHSPAGAAARQFVHYGQGIASGEFRRYDHGNVLSNIRAYGTSRPPNYELSKITAPVFLHYSESDPLAHVEDVDRLFRELGNPMGKLLVPMSKFTHLDFIYAIDGRELLYDRIIDIMKTMDASNFNNVYRPVKSMYAISKLS